MRGIATVIFVGFMSIIAFGIVAPAVIEPVAELVIQSGTVQSSAIDGQGFVEALLNSVLVYAPLLVLGAGVTSAVVWYFRTERVGRRAR